MAQRRMFSLKIVDSDAFLDMGVGSQLLYFHLSMRGDDDGFVGNPKKIMRTIGASEDDMKILLAKRFILAFESGVIVIKHWPVHNLIRPDRYTETEYKQEKSTLGLNENGAYTDRIYGASPLPVIEKSDWQIKRIEVRKESTLPYSFDYKIRNAFYGKECPVCHNKMEEVRVEEMEYTSKLKPSPTIQHNVPISKGGKHELGNISVICHSCNVSLRDTITGPLNAAEVIEVWKSIGNQSAPQVRLGKDRLGKEEESGVSSIKYLSSIPEADMKEFVARFDVSASKVRSIGEDLVLYCQRKGKVYKNYKAFLLNALKRDCKERPAPKPAPAPEKPLTQEERERQAKKIKEIGDQVRGLAAAKKI